MNKDILGKAELESIKLDWTFLQPGYFGGRCAATGTCDNIPLINNVKRYRKNIKISLKGIQETDPIRFKYGSIHSL